MNIINFTFQQLSSLVGVAWQGSHSFATQSSLFYFNFVIKSFTLTETFRGNFRRDDSWKQERKICLIPTEALKTFLFATWCLLRFFHLVECWRKGLKGTLSIKWKRKFAFLVFALLPCKHKYFRVWKSINPLKAKSDFTFETFPSYSVSFGSRDIFVPILISYGCITGAWSRMERKHCWKVCLVYSKSSLKFKAAYAAGKFSI